MSGISRFRFAKGVKVVERFHVGVCSHGAMLKLTDAGSAKLKKALAEHGPDAGYRFDYQIQDAEIVVPIFE